MRTSPTHHRLRCLAALAGFIAAAGALATSGADPAFDCSKVKAGGIEALICQDEQLARLDRKMATVYAAAGKKAANERPPVLKAEQRGWIKGRNECWKSDDKRACIEESYRQRIAELQARYRLVPSSAPMVFACDGNPANELVVTYFETDPPTLIAERGDRVSLMYRQPGNNGIRYQGRNESLWKESGGVRLTWGFGAEEVRCEPAPGR
ncbi:MliC family protein [Microbulbifer guangxiensis]|uniref:MliC family protein n=1 Tax=Microbulbifer guangxiensis TaxID=2904249 RepID=UPI001F2761E7|nr:MliC family protein [Microbulbifer guangxiensis]